MKKIEIPDLKKDLEEKKAKAGANVSELHEFVLKARKDLGETATKGDGSFGFYLGILKRIPGSERYSMLSRAMTAKDPLKAFWYYVGQYGKPKKEQI